VALSTTGRQGIGNLLRDPSYVDRIPADQRADFLEAAPQAQAKLTDRRAGTVFACSHDEPVQLTFAGKPLRLEPGEAAFRSSR